jgi:hypothetical protein
VRNGPCSEIRNNPSSLLEKNREDSPLLIFYTEGRYSFISHIRERKIGPDDSVFIITLFLCRLLSEVCYEEYMTIDVNYCGGYVPPFVRQIFFQNSEM